MSLFKAPIRRRQLLAVAGAAALLPGLSPIARAAKRDRLVLAGPFASVSYPLMRMADTQALNDAAGEISFRTWGNPDQLRALAIEQSADFVAMPSNVAANLFNKGVPLKLLNISVWGLLWMVSREDDLQTLADFRGKEVVMPFRGDMPEIIFNLLCEKQGIKPGEDIKLRYVASPIDAMQLLITRRAENALLAEPAVSMGLSKSHHLPAKIIAPELFRSVDLQAEWGRVLGRPPRIPQAGITALESVYQEPALLERFEQEYDQALQWCLDNPEDCGEMAARYVDMLTPEGVADAMRATAATTTAVSGVEARPELEYFYQLLLDGNPGLVGGKMPGDDFYA